MTRILVAAALIALGADLAYGQECRDKLNVAMLSAAQADWAAANATLGQNAASCADNAEFRYFYGLSLANVSPDSAAKAYEQLRAADSLNEAGERDPELQQNIDEAVPALYAPLTNRAIAQLSAGQTEEAEANLEIALEINTEGKEAYYALGAVHEIREEWEPAVEAFRKALEIDPDLQPALVRLGQVYDAQADAVATGGDAERATEILEQGIEVYEEYLEDHPDAFSVQIGLAKLYADLGESEKAEPIIRAVMESDTISARTLTDLGFEMVNAGQDELAEQLLERAVAVSDTLWSEPLQYLSFVRIRQNDVEGARESLEAQLALDPSNAVAWEYLGHIRRGLGDQEGAAEAFGKAESIPLELTNATLSREPDGTLNAELTFANRLEQQVQDVRLQVHLVSGTGEVLETQEAVVSPGSALAPGQTTRVLVRFTVPAEIARIRYEVVS